jgi:metalloendopeptidase OMA1, mitochondrial
LGSSSREVVDRIDGLTEAVMRNGTTVKLAQHPILVLLALGSLAGVPWTGRKQIVALPPDIEASLGNQLADEILVEEALSTDGRQEVLARVVKRLARQVPGPASKYEWRVDYIASDAPIIYGFPGGRLIVAEGIMPTARTEAGLATVVAHEMAHVIGRHGAERITSELVLTGLLPPASLSLADPTYGAPIIGAFGAGTAIGLVSPYSRKHEEEAQAIGILLLAKAGYDPNASPPLLERWKAEYGDTGSLTYLSNHPASTSLERELTEALPKAMKQYIKATSQYGFGERIDLPR